MTARGHASPKLDHGPDRSAPVPPLPAGGGLPPPLVPLLGTTPDGSCVLCSPVPGSDDVYQVTVEAGDRPAQQQVLYGRLQPIRLPEPPRPRPYHLARQRHEEMLGSIASFVPYFDRSYPPTYVPRFYDSGETQFRIFFGQLSAGVTPARLQGLVYAITGASFTILRVADAECHTANGYCRNGTDQHVIVKSLNGRVVFDEDGAWLVDSGIGLEILKMYDAKAYNPHGPRRPLVAEPQPSQRTLRHSHGSRAAAASTEAAELLVAPLRYGEAVTRRAQSHAEVLTPAIEKRLQSE
jgi:hypothetical protein